MRSMWKGSISFGLVTIPVKLYAATESKDVRFNLLHQECRTPIQYRKWCPNCDREVAMEEVIKGYEFDRGRFVTVAEEEMEAIPIAAARTLDIVDFVHLEQIDPVYFAKTYYLEPGEGGAKSYALLRRAMEESGRIAIARVVIRSKESLAAIRVFQHGVLAMESMHFPDEVRSPAGLTGIEDPALRPQELEMAIGLVSSLSGDFAPEKFHNEYRQQLLDLIHAKISGEEVVQVERRPEQGRVVDLMEALRASIRLAEETRATEGDAPATPRVTAPPGIPSAPGIPVPPTRIPAAAPAIAPGLPPAPGIPAVGTVPVLGTSAPGVPTLAGGLRGAALPPGVPPGVPPVARGGA